MIGGHTRSIGKTQLVCDVIRAFPKVYGLPGKSRSMDMECAPRMAKIATARPPNMCAHWTGRLSRIQEQIAPDSWKRGKALVLAENETRLFGGRAAVAPRSLERGCGGGCARIKGGADRGEQFVDAILEAIAVFCGDRSGQRGLQGVCAKGAGPCKCAGASRWCEWGRPTRAAVDEASHEIAAGEAISFAEGGRRIAATFGGAGVSNDGGGARCGGLR